MQQVPILLKLVLLLNILLCVACAPITPAVVVEREVTGVKQETDRIGGSVIRFVQPGDTLYAIAFASGLDVRDLAAWNNLSLDARIEVGQKLRLTKPLNFVAKPPAPSKSSSTASANTKVQSRASETAKNTSRKTQRPVRQTTATGQSSKSNTVSSSATVWQWPLRGKLLRGFALSRGQQGVDIEGAIGQSVMASAAGEIVYVGNGLKGYGNLIIIKHNDEFLSAYAYNQAVFVKEGEQVKQASVIGSIGTNQRGEAALQFQIRKQGSPVNPLSYLPDQR